MVYPKGLVVLSVLLVLHEWTIAVPFLLSVICLKSLANWYPEFAMKNNNAWKEAGFD